jgi:hypothetical protein
MAAQLSFTNVRSLRALPLWRARAISSLPVPVSPVMSTAESVGATTSTCRSTSRTVGLSPITSSIRRSVRISSSR